MRRISKRGWGYIMANFAVAVIMASIGVLIMFKKKAVK